jgi:hypothetical protein
MPHYENACIYKIKHYLDYDDENIYIGSTCNLIKRRSYHKYCCNNEKTRNYNFPLYQYIRENGGWHNYIMIKIHDYNCNSKSELEVEERRVLDLLKPKLNKCIPKRSNKEWYQDNKQIILEKVREYRKANKEVRAERNKNYYEANKEVLVENMKKYNEANKEVLAEKRKEWYEANRDKRIEQMKQYHQDNRNKILEKNKEKCKCDICGAEVRKDSLARHKRTQKCLSVKNNI